MKSFTYPICCFKPELLPKPDLMTDYVLLKMQRIGGCTKLLNIENFLAVPDCEFEMKRPCTSPLDRHQNLDIPKQPKFFKINQRQKIGEKNHLQFNLFRFPALLQQTACTGHNKVFINKSS